MRAPGAKFELSVLLPLSLCHQVLTLMVSIWRPAAAASCTVGQVALHTKSCLRILRPGETAFDATFTCASKASKAITKQFLEEVLFFRGNPVFITGASGNSVNGGQLLFTEGAASIVQWQEPVRDASAAHIRCTTLQWHHHIDAWCICGSTNSVWTQRTCFTCGPFIEKEVVICCPIVQGDFRHGDFRHVQPVRVPGVDLEPIYLWNECWSEMGISVPLHAAFKDLITQQ